MSIIPETHAELAEYPVVLRLPVQWGEMDAYGHVNNAVFFRYFESVRMDYLEQCGLLASYQHSRLGAILHSTTCRFRRPVHHPDTVLVGGRVSLVEADRFTMLYRVVSLAQDAVAAEGSGVIVAFDYEQARKTALPDDVRERITALERRATTDRPL